MQFLQDVFVAGYVVDRPKSPIAKPYQGNGGINEEESEVKSSYLIVVVRSKKKLKCSKAYKR